MEEVHCICRAFFVNPEKYTKGERRVQEMNASKRNNTLRMCCHNPHTIRHVNFSHTPEFLCINFLIKWIECILFFHSNIYMYHWVGREIFLLILWYKNILLRYSIKKNIRQIMGRPCWPIFSIFANSRVEFPFHTKILCMYLYSSKHHSPGFRYQICIHSKKLVNHFWCIISWTALKPYTKISSAFLTF